MAHYARRTKLRSLQEPRKDEKRAAAKVCRAHWGLLTPVCPNRRPFERVRRFLNGHYAVKITRLAALMRPASHGGAVLAGTGMRRGSALPAECDGARRVGRVKVNRWRRTLERSRMLNPDSQVHVGPTFVAGTRLESVPAEKGRFRPKG